MRCCELQLSRNHTDLLVLLDSLRYENAAGETLSLTRVSYLISGFAIERDDVRKAFARKGVIVLRGDWTRRDPAISRFLLAQDAAGVPLYLWYPAGDVAPRKLDQVLSPSTLTDLAGE